MPLRRSMSLNNVRVAVTAGAEKSPRFQRSRTSCEDSSRLASIMTFEPLRAAFGDFCYKCLCGEASTRGQGPEGAHDMQGYWDRRLKD